MAEDLEIYMDEVNEEQGTSLLAIIGHQIDALFYFKEIDFSSLYDKAEEDKVKCVGNCFYIIAAAQEALLKQIKTL